jgi:hypothetical protein
MSLPGDLEKKDNFPLPDQPASHDLDRALAEAAPLSKPEQAALN